MFYKHCPVCGEEPRSSQREVGQILEARPMAVLYLILATWAGCLAIFASATVVAARGEQQARSRNYQESGTSETYQNQGIIQ